MQEIWKDVPGYEGFYQVSNFGRIKSLVRKYVIREIALKLHQNKSTRYFYVALCKGKGRNMFTVHQLIAMAFLNHKPNGYKLVVDHIDFDRENNHVDNLRLITVRENTSKSHLKSKSKYVGVLLNTESKRWYAQIKINGKGKHLGCFNSELEASKAYQSALQKLMQ